MTTEPNIYTTIGHECGCCGHRHRSVREAGQCHAEHRQQQQRSDRRVVAVAADAAWAPTEGRDLNDAELHDLYADDCLPAGSGPRSSTSHRMSRNRPSASRSPKTRPTATRGTAPPMLAVAVHRTRCAPRRTGFQRLPPQAGTTSHEMRYLGEGPANAESERRADSPAVPADAPTGTGQLPKCGRAGADREETTGTENDGG